MSTEISLNVLAYNLKRVLDILGFAQTIIVMRLVGREPLSRLHCMLRVHQEAIR